MVNVRRAEVAARIQEAKEHGDITENAEYEDAKNEQAFVEGRIQSLQALIKNAIIIDENHSTDHVQIGSTVELEGDRRQGDVHHRRLGGGRAARRPHLQRVARRPGAAGQEEGRQGHGRRPGGRHGLQDRQHQLTRSATDDVLGRRAGSGSSAGPQVVNDSKTPSGTVHVGSLRGVVLHDAIARALRDRGLETALPVRRRRPRPHGRPGAADARRRRPLHGRAAGPRAGTRGQHRPPAMRATSSASCSWAPSRASASIPSIYWMSELYADGTMDPYIRTALDRGRVVRDLYLRVSKVEKAGRLAAGLGHLRELRQDRHDAGHRLGRRDGRLRLPARLRDLGAGLRPRRPRGAVRRPRQAALQRGLGRQVEPLRHHRRGLRQGPGHGRRVARPHRRRQPARCSTASRRSTCPTSS